MADLTPVESFDDVYQLETTDLALAGTSPSQVMNRQPQALLNRTEFLRAQQLLDGAQITLSLKVLGDYALGLEFTEQNQAFRYLDDLYVPTAGMLPYTTDGSGAAEIALFHNIGSAVLRQDLEDTSSDPTKGAGIPTFDRDVDYLAGAPGSTGAGLNVINRSIAIPVIAYGVEPHPSNDQTAAIQAVIDQFDGPGANLWIKIADGIKFTLIDLTHNATSALAIEYSFGDDLAFPNSAVGNSQQRMMFLDSGVSGISDNNTAYHSAPYHPAMILDMRSDYASQWLSAGQRRTPINGSFIISCEAYTRLQLAYRDFNRDGADLPDTNARKSGIDLTIWRAQWTITGVTSASWGVPPVAGNLVETADGRLFVVRFIDGSGMVLYQRHGNIQVGDTLIFNGVASSTTVATEVRALTSLINRLSANGYDGAVGINIAPERVVNANLGVGGALALEKGAGSIYGTSEPLLYQVDVMSAPTKGFYTRYNVTTSGWEVYTHANVLMARCSPGGSMKLSGGITPAGYTDAELNDSTHAVNTTDKFQHKSVGQNSTGRPVYAQGSGVNAVWNYSDGTLANTPIP